MYCAVGGVPGAQREGSPTAQIWQLRGKLAKHGALDVVTSYPVKKERASTSDRGNSKGKCTACSGTTSG